MAVPGVTWVSIKEVGGWADILVQLDWQAGSERINGSRTWVQGKAIVKAMRPHLAENREAV